MTKIQRKSLLLALAFSLVITGVLIYFEKIKSLNSAPLVEIVVASTDIPVNTAITEAQLVKIEIPEKFILADAVRDVNQIVGKYAKGEIFQGEQIVNNRLMPDKKREGLSGNLPAGYRAVALEVDSESGVNQKIKIGDYVDIQVFLQPPFVDKECVKTILQKVQVIDAGSGGSGSGEYLVTLCLNPKDTEELFLSDSLGKIRLALRPQED